MYLSNSAIASSARRRGFQLASIATVGALFVSINGCNVTTDEELSNPDNTAGASSEANSEESVGTSANELSIACGISAAFEKKWCTDYYCYWDMCDPSACEKWYKNALAMCSANLVAVRRASRKVEFGTSFHVETMVLGSDDTLEATFLFASAPQPGANQAMINHCVAPTSNNKYLDFLSLSPTCEGKKKIVGLGYSFAPNTPGAKPVYRCITGKDHFISRDPNCEGRISEGLIGYAK